MFALIFAVLFLGGLAGWHSWQESREKKAQVALYESQNRKEALEVVFKSFPRTRAAVLAGTALGAAARDAADFDACIGHFESIYERGGVETYFQVLALQEIGTCYRAKGDYKKGAHFFDRAAKEPGNKAPLISRFEAIRCRQMDNDPETEALYQALLAEKNLDPQLKEKIEEQLSWLKPQKGS